MNNLNKYLCAAFLFFVFAFVAIAAPPQNPGNGSKELSDQLAALTARVAKLEGQITAADLAGTYSVYGLQVELSPASGAPNARPNQVSSYVFTGTATFNADSTGTLNSISESGNTLAFGLGTPSVTPFQGNGGGSSNFQWTYANGTITTNGTGFPVSVAAGGKILVSAGANHSDGTNVILVFTRLQ